MAELSGLDGLLAQFKKQARETIRAEFQAETELLRTENSLLHNKIGEKDLLHQDVIRQRDELFQEVQSLKLEIKNLNGRLKSESSLRSGDTQRRCGNFEIEINQRPPPIKGKRDPSDQRELAQQSLENQDEPNARSVTFGGFEILERPGTKFYRDMFDCSTSHDKGAALRKALLFFKPSEVKAEILRPHAWELLGIERATVEGKDDCDQDPEDSLLPEPKDIENPEISFQTPKQPKAQREREQRAQARSSWLNSNGFAPKDRGFPIDARGSRLASVVPRKRHAEEIPFAELSSEDFNTMLDRRRSVCLRCWRTGEFCDGRGQCGACKRAGLTCEHKPCGYGLACPFVRCARLHPDQWNPLDGDWFVRKHGIDGRNKGVDGDPRSTAKRRVKDSWKPADNGMARFQS
ncbi:hypothetical protein AC578_11099 [Pseudocercospora eumusae]|uniref:Uncharacterized protein n=1 Tax=Pseudocercospora eumusae TaxID=321146 RepID=A0A139HSI6_9PEZI|nr:hypothetical protein AC578_11099 [Pseudocercospora eumusae]